MNTFGTILVLILTIGYIGYTEREKMLNKRIQSHLNLQESLIGGGRLINNNLNSIVGGTLELIDKCENK